MLDPNSKRRNSEDFGAAARVVGFAVMVFPFLVNDFASIYAKDWRVWIAVDYLLVRLPAIVVFAMMLKTKVATPVDFGITRQRLLSFITTFAGMTVCGILILKYLGPVFSSIFVHKYGSYPVVTSALWKNVDLSLGLALTGFTEELIFRGLAYTVMKRKFGSDWKVLVASSVLFGLIHWNGGIQHIICAGLVGAAFMAFYIKTKSTPALMAAHWAIDLYFFGLA